MLGATTTTLRRAGIAAISAALVATLSDLTLLWYAESAALGVRLPPAGLTVATDAGVLGILGYAAGYWQLACGLLPAGERPARRVLLFGAAMACVGAVIHGMTGVTLRYETLPGGDPSPAHVIAPLLPLWLLGTSCGAVVTVAYVGAILRGPTAFPRWMAAANPLVLPVAVGVLLSLAGPRVRAFGVPAAPNIAHVIFFGLTTFRVRSSQSR